MKVFALSLLLAVSISLGPATAQDETTLINGLQLRNESWWPSEGGNAFIIMEQYDNNCGPTSVEMVLHYYAKYHSLADVWNAGGIHSVEFGAWPWELRQALNGLGVPTHWYDGETLADLRYYVRNNRLPIILLRFENGLHWVVVVGYYGEDWYLVADPNGWFSWYHKDDLNVGWSLQRPGIQRSVPNAFSLEGIGVWIVAELADIGLGSNNVIVPRYAPTQRFTGFWSEMQGIYVSGRNKFGGTTRGWETTLTFDDSIDFYNVSAIELLSSLGTVELDGHRKIGSNTVKVWGRIEDGAVLRGRMWVIVRTLREAGRLAAPTQQNAVPMLPTETTLLPNYPNPFNPETWIPYHLAESADVTLRIYSVDGKLVRTLALGYQAAGTYHGKSRAAYWDGRNNVGERVASGIYFYTLTADEFSATRKMLIMK